MSWAGRRRLGRCQIRGEKVLIGKEMGGRKEKKKREKEKEKEGKNGWLRFVRV